MDDIYFLNVNVTAAGSLDTNWHHVMFNVSGIVAKNFANSFLYCNQFSESFKDVNAARAAKFKDFTDIYTSFLFNLLGKSLNIKTHATNLEIYQSSL